MLSTALFLCICALAYSSDGVEFREPEEDGVEFREPEEVKSYSLNDILQEGTEDAHFRVQNGEEACEGHGYDYEECENFGCCHYDDDQETCLSKVGQGQCMGSVDNGDSRRRADGRRRRSFASQMTHVNWDEASKHIVDGMMRSFFVKTTLNQVETECLETKLGAATGDIAGLVQSGVQALRPVLAPKKGEERASIGSLLPQLISGVAEITDLIEAVTYIAKNCLAADGLALLNQTAQKFSNFTYVEHALLANGVDITKALAEAVVDFEEMEFQSFGHHIGIAARKVLLSTNTGGALALPEGYATERAIEESSTGISQGFFAPGSVLRITDVADSDVDIQVDLHECIVDNHDLFKDIFKSIWELIAMFAANNVQHGLFVNASLQTQGQGIGGSPLWVQEIILALARLPMALQRCNLLNDGTEDMMEEAFKTLGSLRFDFSFPDDKVQADEATEKVAQAVELWTRKDYGGFGRRLGKLFRELLLLAFPREYSVDEHGYLRRQLTMAGFIRRNKEDLKQKGPIAVAGVAFMFLMSMLAFRATKSWRNNGRRLLLDVEASELEDDIETLE